MKFWNYMYIDVFNPIYTNTDYQNTNTIPIDVIFLSGVAYPVTCLYDIKYLWRMVSIIITI